jgi:6-phospho-beta-glucosidase
MSFPEGFLWGTATSALQIEGAVREDGRGPSMWDVFCAEHPERIHGAATPEVACDHYRRFREDVAWMRELGHNAYRFSIAWPRVVPDGDGALNPLGLDFYERLVDSLLEAGITPCATLYHWDLPQPLAERGGWERRATLDAFVRYAEACFERLGDRVPLWATLNEPGWSTLHGYVTGLHPPARRDLGAAVRASHHLLVAHARAVLAGRAQGVAGALGIALNLSPIRPATASEADARAAATADAALNGWFSDAVLHGRHAPAALEAFERCGILPAFEPVDLDALAAAAPALGFLGINYYCPHHASADAPESRFAVAGAFRFVRARGARHTDWAWEIDPAGLGELLDRLRAERSGLPLYVTENGLGRDERLLNGRLDDQPRIVFVRQHLEVVEAAIARGADVRGFFLWSLLDNFSWLNGYKKRYGLLHVEPGSLRRVPKTSALWYRGVAARNGPG